MLSILSIFRHFENEQAEHWALTLNFRQLGGWSWVMFVRCRAFPWRINPSGDVDYGCDSDGACLWHC